MYMYNNKLWKNVLNVPKKYPQNVILMCNRTCISQWQFGSKDVQNVLIQYQPLKLVKSPSLKVIKGDYLQWGTPVCLVFLHTIPIHLKLAHHCSLAVLHVSVQYFKWLLKKTQWYSGFLKWERSGWLTSWVVRWMTWSSSWLCSCNTITPLSNVFSLKQGSCVMTKGDVRLKHIQY